MKNITAAVLGPRHLRAAMGRATGCSDRQENHFVISAGAANENPAQGMGSGAG